MGDLSPTRDFNYVLDTCCGFIALAEADKSVGEVFNIGSGKEVSVGDTLNLIKELMDSDVEFITDENRLRPKDSEVFRLCCDNTKIRKLSGFEPRYALREGLQETIAWFTQAENLARYKVNIYNV